jgi:hypothetical protein
MKTENRTEPAVSCQLGVNEKQPRFLNFYRHEDCPVDPGVSWDDTWDSMCDNECPACGQEITPCRSEDTMTGESVN